MITIRSSNSDNSHTSICIKLVNLTIFFALGMMAIGIFVVATIFSANDGPSTRTKELLRLSLSNSISNIWATTILVFFLTCCLLLSKKGFRTFNLCKILKFLNLIQLIFPFLLFFSLTSFDFETTFETWIKHYWLLDGFTWYREAFCAEGTAQTTCAAPIGGGANYANVTIFCTSTYNSTTCEQIQQEAQDDLAIFSWFMLTFFGVVGCLICLLIIVLTRFVKLLVNNKSIIVESEIRFVPYWLITPMICCFYVGRYLNNEGGDEKDSSTFFLSTSFRVAASLFLLSFVISWMVEHDSARMTWCGHGWKKRKVHLVLMFLVVHFLTVALILAICIYAILTFVTNVNVEDNEENVLKLACEIDGSSGSNTCLDCPFSCPEWNEMDVANVLRSQIKYGGTVCLVLLLYSSKSLRIGREWFKFYKDYREEYI